MFQFLQYAKGSDKYITALVAQMRIASKLIDSKYTACAFYLFDNIKAISKSMIVVNPLNVYDT